MSDSELSDVSRSLSPPPATSPERPSGNRYDTMFGSDHDEPESAARDEGTKEEDDEDDEDAGTRKRSRREVDDEDEQLDDLFGEEDGEEGGAPKELDDTELAGTPEIDEGTPAPPEPERFVELSIPLHAGPRYGGDNGLYLMKIPNFLSMESVLFDPEKFTAPTVDPGSTTSAYTQATNSIRFRRNPRDFNKMQSNARIIRWSDGSLSLQIASSPNLYDLPGKALTSDPNKPEKYVSSEDSHLYVLDPQQSADALRVVGHVTQSLGVLSASATLASDHAIQRLQSELAGSINRSRKNLELSELKDPESDRREAERVVKEKERMNKKQEAQRRRARDRDPLESAARRSYQRVTGTRSKRDSPPLPGRGRGREDEYDLEDGFIEGSDEDEEEAEGSDEEEEEEEFEERRPRRERESERDRKRRRVVDESDEE